MPAYDGLGDVAPFCGQLDSSVFVDDGKTLSLHSLEGLCDCGRGHSQSLSETRSDYPCSLAERSVNTDQVFALRYTHVLCWRFGRHGLLAVRYGLGIPVYKVKPITRIPASFT